MGCMPTLFQCDSCHIYLIDEHTTTIWKSDKIYYKHTKLLQGSKKITMKLYKRHQDMKHVIRRSQGLSSAKNQTQMGKPGSDIRNWSARCFHLSLIFWTHYLSLNILLLHLFFSFCLFGFIPYFLLIAWSWLLPVLFMVLLHSVLSPQIVI